MVLIFRRVIFGLHLEATVFRNIESLLVKEVKEMLIIFADNYVKYLARTIITLFTTNSGDSVDTSGRFYGDSIAAGWNSIHT